MPAVHDPITATHTATVAASAPTELYALASLLSFDVLQGDVKSPIITEVQRADPSLAGRFSRLYFAADSELATAQGCTCWEGSELLVLAHRSGTLFDTDGLDRFFDAAEAAASQDLEPGFAMPTERPVVEAMVRDRLLRLRDDLAWRGEWLDSFRALWATVRETWESTGRHAAREEADRLHGMVEAGQQWENLLPARHLAREGNLRNVADAAAARGELVITPLSFAGRLKHIVAFPGVVSIGFGRGEGLDIASLRERAGHLTGTFKELSDPTRATILALLVNSDYSVSDLTDVLHVSQPTISHHVKQLRDAGMLDMVTDGRVTRYRASRERIDQDVAEALRQLFSGC
jgi:ArsR family transcriptional regulator